jgi:hypothetical protein
MGVVVLGETFLSSTNRNIKIISIDNESDGLRIKREYRSIERETLDVGEDGKRVYDERVKGREVVGMCVCFSICECVCPLKIRIRRGQQKRQLLHQIGRAGWLADGITLPSPGNR